MNQCLRAVSSSYFHDSRMKSQFLLLIYHIGLCDGISQKELSESVPFDKFFISTMTKELIELEFVRNDSQGRLHLTDQGRDIFITSKMMFNLLDRDFFDILVDKKKEMLGEVMRKMDAHLDELIIEFSENE